MNSQTAFAKTHNAVLLLVFNRPDTTRRVFEAIRQARPPRLYIASDGPRLGNSSDIQAIAEVRQIVEAVGWPCQVYTRFQEKNLGCRAAVSSAIDWFFGCEEQGIVLEDDVLPSPAFFEYCDLLLERYKNDDRVFSISGNNLVEPRMAHAEGYFFSSIFYVWGWASWRRAWQKFDVDMKTWPQIRSGGRSLNRMPKSRLHSTYWNLVFDLTHKKQISTCWDHQWTYTHWYYEGLCATPVNNLVKNIGFGMEATHTSITEPWYIKSMQTPNAYRDSPEMPEVKESLLYYDLMSRFVLNVSWLTVLRLSLRRWPKTFSLLKRWSNQVRAIQWRGQ